MEFKNLINLFCGHNDVKSSNSSKSSKSSNKIKIKEENPYRNILKNNLNEIPVDHQIFLSNNIGRYGIILWNCIYSDSLSV